MVIRKAHLFAGAIACAPFPSLIGSLLGFPTHVSLLWYAIQLFLAVHLLPLKVSFLERLASRAVIPSLYAVAFIVASYFGASFAESQKYRVLWLPLMLIDFAAWYSVGYFVKEQKFLRYFTVSACAFAAISLALSAITTQERVLSGPDVPFAISPAVMMSSTALVIFLLLASFASLKKTVVACSMAAFAYCYLTNKFSRYRWEKYKSRIRITGIDPLIKWLIGSVVSLAVLAIVAVQAQPLMTATVDRVTSEGGEDTLRLAAIVEFLYLLPLHWPQGAGYYTFGFLTADTINFTTVTADGDILYGMSLHNSFMHWILEGGLSIVVIVCIMAWAYYRAVRRLRQWPEAIPLARILMGWAVVGVVYGMFNQFHATQYFFGMIGYAAGCLDRYRYHATS